MTRGDRQGEDLASDTGNLVIFRLRIFILCRPLFMAGALIEIGAPPLRDTLPGFAAMIARCVRRQPGFVRVRRSSGIVMAAFTFLCLYGSRTGAWRRLCGLALIVLTIR